MKILIVSFLLLVSLSTRSQDISFNRKMVDTLTSPYFWGRGYTNDGMKKAASFLADELKSFGVKPLDGKNYFQEFSYPANTFPGKMEVEINGTALVPGVDFIVGPESKGTKAKGTLLQKDSTHFIDLSNRVIITLEDKLTWSVEQQAADYTALALDKNKISQIPTSYKINIDNKFISNFKTANVCGVVQGTVKPDSFIFITAHYDHLGGMGKDTYFPPSQNIKRLN